MGGKNRAAANNLAIQLPVNNNPVNNAVLPCRENRDPQLRVKVWGKRKSQKKQYVQATVNASALTQASVAGTGLADFSYVNVGTYDVRVAPGAVLLPDNDLFYSEGNTQQVTLNKGDKTTLEIEVKPRNIVTPKIEAEYKVVIFDRGMVAHQSGANEPIGDYLPPDPTYVEVWAECSEDAPDYTGDGTFTAPNCDIFLDAQCQTPLAGRKLTNAELKASPHTKLYLRGTARGLFTATLTLDPEPDPRFDIKGPATEAMGVVQLQLEIYEHSTPVNVAANTYALTGYCTDLQNANLIPDQVLLSDNDKVTRGRLLHKQKDKNNGRAKAVLKVTAGEWPGGTDPYQIVLESKPASDLRAYDAEKDGSRIPLPFKTTAATLKLADKTLWIEGAKDSEALRAARLTVGLDRAAGGLAKTAKNNADWGRFTVANIESVKLDYTPPAAGNPKPWNASKKRWYINYQAGDPGRTVRIRAKLSKPLAGIAIYFMLSPDKDNLQEKNWGIDLPVTWPWGGVAADVKQKDKVNATDLLHMTQNTDAQGQADCDLVLSRIGGDVFWPAAYIRQDPHLAAYVDGHVELSKRKPKLADDPIKVWRKFAYIKVKVEGRNYPSTRTAEEVYGRVRAEMFKRPSRSLTKAQVQAMARPCLLPEYMFRVGGGTQLRLNVSDANQSQFFGGLPVDGEHPITIPMVTCDFNWANERASAVVVGLDDLVASTFPINVLTDVHVCDPPVQGGPLLASGDWVAAEWDAAANAGQGAWVNVRNGQLAQGDVDIDRRRDDINKVRIRFPAGAGAILADTYIWITNFAVNGAPDHYLGGYNINPAAPQTIVAVYDPADAADYQNTVGHEIGHAFFQTGDPQPRNGRAASSPAGGIPANPSYLWTPTGHHCNYDTNKCLMFTSGPIVGSLNRYCPNCHPLMLVQNMTAIS